MGGTLARSPDLPAISLPGDPLKDPSRKKNGSKVRANRNLPLYRDALFIVRRNGEHHVIAESYFYKTDPYYTILSLENEGRTVRPSSSAVLDAYVIPVCLERARSAGIPVCEWGISQAYVPLPSLVYGLNYYANNADYAIVRDNDAAKDVIRHITNNGKYPFCFQKFPEGSTIHSCTAIFGETIGTCSAVARNAKAIYGIFGIPLVRMVWVKNKESCALSSLSPLRYADLSGEERSLLSAHISNQVSL
jgi:hypothetical protein